MCISDIIGSQCKVLFSDFIGIGCHELTILRIIGNAVTLNDAFVHDGLRSISSYHGTTIAHQRREIAVFIVGGKTIGLNGKRGVCVFDGTS